MDKRIPVVVVSGLPGSGKTWLIERLLRDEPRGSIAVLARAQGTAPAGALYRLGGSSDAAPEGACPCCSLNGELAGALRDLFMAALQRRIAVPRQVLIETEGRGDPAAILYSLQHDAFLRERYFYRGCITTVAAQSRLDGIGLRQAVLADALVLGPAPATGIDPRGALRSLLEEINPLAACFDADELPDLAHMLARGTALDPPPLKEPLLDERPLDEPLQDELSLDGSSLTESSLTEPSLDEPSLDEPPSDASPLDRSSLDRPPLDKPSLDESLLDEPARAAGPVGSLWSGAHAGRLRPQSGVAVLRLAGRCALARPDLVRAMDVLQGAYGDDILRIAGVLRLHGEAGAWELRGVHRQLYWQAVASASPGESSLLIVVLEAGAASGFLRRAEALLSGLRAMGPASRGAA